MCIRDSIYCVLVLYQASVIYCVLDLYQALVIYCVLNLYQALVIWSSEKILGPLLDLSWGIFFQLCH